MLLNVFVIHFNDLSLEKCVKKKKKTFQKKVVHVSDQKWFIVTRQWDGKLLSPMLMIKKRYEMLMHHHIRSLFVNNHWIRHHLQRRSSDNYGHHLHRAYFYWLCLMWIRWFIDSIAFILYLYLNLNELIHLHKHPQPEYLNLRFKKILLETDPCKQYTYWHLFYCDQNPN